MNFKFYLLSSLLFLATVGAEECKDYTFEQCTDAAVLFEGPADDENEDCQNFLCNLQYGGECTYYVYNNKTNTCTLFSNREEDRIRTCKIIGGPKGDNGADISTCLTKEDECKYFVSGGLCQYFGTPKAPITLSSVEKCQAQCAHDDDCQYFKYDSGDLSCVEFDSAVKECDEFWGTPEPTSTKCRDE